MLSPLSQAQGMATESEVKSNIREFLQDNFLYARPGFVLSDSDSLLQKGIVDSMGVMEVLSFLEEKFNVVPADNEITEDNLGSVDAITRFVLARS